MDPIFLKNWAENLQYNTTNVHYPETVEEVQQLIKKLSKMKALGSRHSFNSIADNDQNLISTQKLNKIVALDKEQSTVTVEGGMKYGELCEYLHENGFALHNLASLPHISIAGSISTATHGSGVENGNLASSVSGIEFINAKGELIQLSREDGDVFNGAVVGLGALGLVTKVTLDLVPTFEVAQVVYRNLPMEALKDNFNAIMSMGYSVSLFLDWKTNLINEVWVKKKLQKGETPDFPKELFGAPMASENVHPVESISAESCTEQLGIPGPWYDRLPHFKMEFQPSAGKELQSEYFIPFAKAYEALMAVNEIADQISPHLFISEIRAIKGDNLWMSTCYQQDSVAIHTTWKQEIPEVMALLPKMEQKLAPFNPKPHWGKLFTIPYETLNERYSRMDDFKGLLEVHDPNGKFRNDFINKNIYGLKSV
ncbi:FAD-binding protein [Shivajiella indica]|uniref:FAD-binding protein n=2 Tax=Shivajiella indica TaxID=872115 RepID=A0ABW5BBE0_9BACT